MPTLPSGFTAILAANIQDATGTPLASGSLQVQPTDANDNPVSASAGGTAGGLITWNPEPFVITDGALPAGCWVPDVSQTRPAWISYRFTICDAVGNVLMILKGVQPTGASLSLDTYQPAAATVQPPQYIASIPDGVTGVQYQIGVNLGQLVALPVSLANGTPFALVLADTSTSIHYALTIYQGSVRVVNIGTLGNAVAGVTLIDSDGQHVTMTFNNGKEQYANVASTVPGVSQILLADSYTGQHYAIAFANGSRTLTPHA